MRRHLTVAILALGLATSAGAAPITYTAVLSGANESPANASPATGMATVIIDDVANTLEVSVDFAGLTAMTSDAHIHCCTPAPGAGNIGVAVGSRPADSPLACSPAVTTTRSTPRILASIPPGSGTISVVARRLVQKVRWLQESPPGVRT